MLETRAGDVVGTWWGAWEGSQLTAPLSSASSDPEKSSRLLNPPSWGTLGNVCSSLPQPCLGSWGELGQGGLREGSWEWDGMGNPRARCGLVGRGGEGEALAEPLGNSCPVVIQQWGDILGRGQLHRDGVGAPGGSRGSGIEVSGGHRHKFMEPLGAQCLQMILFETNVHLPS